MAKIKKIVVIRDLSDKDNTEVSKMALGTKTTGDPDVTNMPVSDTDFHKQANDSLDVQVQRQTDQSKSLTAKGNELCSKVRTSYFQNSGRIQDLANNLVATTGSYDAGVALVLRCGYLLKTKSEVHPRGFEIIDSGPGWVHLRVKAVGNRAGYIFRLGITTEKGVIPTTFLTILFSLQCEVVIMGLKSGSMYGFQFASILPVAQTKNSDPSQTASSKTATTTMSTKANKTVYVMTNEIYQWSDFIYQGVQ